MRAKTTLLSIFEQTERPSRGGLSEIRSGVLIVNVRSCPKADKLLRCRECPLSAMNGLMHCSIIDEALSQRSHSVIQEAGSRKHEARRGTGLSTGSPYRPRQSTDCSGTSRSAERRLTISSVTLHCLYGQVPGTPSITEHFKRLTCDAVLVISTCFLMPNLRIGQLSASRFRVHSFSNACL
jgi:hypothetical protein